MATPPEGSPLRLPPLSVERASAVLAVPEVPQHAVADVALACAAAEAAVPLLLLATEGERPLLAVRALHALAHRQGAVWLAPLDGPGALPDGAATVAFLLGAEREPPPGLLEASLDEPAAWIVVVCPEPSHLPASLAQRLRAAVLRLPPLRERTGDLAVLAPAVLRAVAARSGRPAPALTPEALGALAAHAWPGGRVELEAVLSRALLIAGAGGQIAPDMLDFSAPAPEAPQPHRAAADTPGMRLEYLLAELAHELRNPLVTVKTFAQQLPALLEDEALRTRFAELTDDAVDRMDALLENVLAFARLQPPQPEALDVGSVLDGVLSELSSTLGARDLRVRRVGGGAQCAADREHLRYALSNLLLGIANETPPRAELVVDASVNGTVSLRFGTGAAISRLRELAAPGHGALDDPTFLPLAFTLARAVLERTGGGLGVVPDLGGQATVTVRLPPVESPVMENGGNT